MIFCCCYGYWKLDWVDLLSLAMLFDTIRVRSKFVGLMLLSIVFQIKPRSSLF